MQFLEIINNELIIDTTMHQTIPVTYIISGIPTQIPTKLAYEWNDEYDNMYNIHIVVEIEGVVYVSKHNLYFEHEIMAFQKMLPEHIKIACCESCMHGNFCPYGDQENEVFCFKDKVFSEKMDVCNEFTNEKEYWTRSKKLLDYCDDYEPMDHENHYTYTSWDV